MFSSKLKTGFLLALVLAASIVFSGCGESSYSDNEKGEGALFKVEKSSLPRITPQESLEDIVTLSEKNNDFAIGLYKQISGNEGNLVFSPYSISLAMAMLYAGAEGETQKQISDVFNFPIPQDSLHPLFNTLDLALASRGNGAKGQDGKEFRLNVANQIFIQDGFSMLEEYLDTLALYYGAGIGILDFENNPEESAQIINRWIEEKTEGLIKDALKKETIKDGTKLALVNTIYLNAAWARKFSNSLTSKGDFFPEDKPSVQADMMHQTASFPYYIGKECTAVELPYDGNEISMLLIMPQNSVMSAFEEQFTPDVMDNIINSLNTGEVRLFMPKFKFYGDSLNLNAILSEMGMPVAFSDDADLSGIAGKKGLKVTDVIHKAYIDVNEEGTTAAGATVIIMGPTCAPDIPVEIVFNRPFIFIIRDIETHSILFMGRVSNPS
jgi:serpin B